MTEKVDMHSGKIFCLSEDISVLPREKKISIYPNNYNTWNKNNKSNLETTSEVRLYYKFHNLKTKLHKTIANIWFNKRCLDQNIIPKFAQIKIKNEGYVAQKIKKQAEIMWLKNEIKYLYRKKDEINKLLLQAHLELSNYVHPHIFKKFWEHSHTQIKIQMKNKYEIMERKLNKLHITQNKIFNNKFYNNEKKFYQKVKNLTNIKFNKEEESLLNKGLKHNLPTTYNSKTIDNMLIETEMALQKIPQEDRNEARCIATNTLRKIINKKQTQEKNKDNITANNIQNKINRNNAIISKADKGNTVVIMDKTEYIKKTLEFIEINNCIELKKDPTAEYQKEIKRIKKSANLIFDDKEITSKTINMNPKPPILNGLPKLHKDGIPIRPVVNYINAPGYLMAKKLALILKEKTNLPNLHNVKNSQELACKIINIEENKNLKLTSFDIKNLYSNIPVQETIKILENNLINCTLIEKTQIINSLKTVLEQNYFQFNNKIYKQRTGLAMGSPLSAIMSEIFLQKIEEKLIPKIMNEYNVKYWFRYVDDCLCIIEENTDRINLLDELNQTHPNLKFTEESEVNNSINFLDIKIQNNNGKLNLEIYRKPTATDSVIHKTSNHPQSHKLAAFNSLAYRLNTIPIDKRSYSKEVKIIKTIGRNNGYNAKDICKTLQKFRNKNKPQDQEDNDKKSNKWTSLTYTGKETYQLSNIFKKYGLNISLKTNNKLKGKFKPRIENYNKYKQSGIYKLKCKTCDKIYVGQSGREIQTRYNEHIQAIRKSYNTSNFAQHILDHDHEYGKINDTMELITTGKKGNKMNLLESLNILRYKLHNKIINEQTDLYGQATFKIFHNYLQGTAS